MTDKNQCGICSQILLGQQLLKDHLFSKHGIGEPNVCACGKSFMWKKNLLSHQKKQCPLTAQVMIKGKP